MPHCAAVLLCLGLAAHTQPSANPRAAYTRALELEKEGNHAAALALLWEAAGACRATRTCRTGSARRSIGSGRSTRRSRPIDRAVAVRPGFRQGVQQPDSGAREGGPRTRGASSGRGRGWRRRRPMPTASSRSAWPSPNRTSTRPIATFRRVLTHGAGPRAGALQPGAGAEAGRSRLRRDRRAVASARDRAAARSALHARPASISSREISSSAERALTAAIAAEPRYVDAHVMLGAVLKAQRRVPRRGGSAAPGDRAAPRSVERARDPGAGLEARWRRGRGRAVRRPRRNACGCGRRSSRKPGVWTAVGTASLDAGDIRPPRSSASGAPWRSSSLRAGPLSAGPGAAAAGAARTPRGRRSPEPGS